MLNWNRPLAFPLLIILGVLAAESSAEDKIDPAIFVAPKGSPAFREVLKGDDWKKQLAAEVARLGDLDQLKDSARPEAGTWVARIDDGGQAKALGMVIGDVLSEVDDKPIYQKNSNEVRTSEDQQITVVGPDAMPRKLAIHSGKIGFNGLEVVYPERVYLRHGKRGAKWDAFAVVGAANCLANADLAETAWFHAMEAGYVADCISDYCGCQIAWRQGRAEEAVAFGAMLSTYKEVPPALDRETFIRQLGIAHFKIEQTIGGRMLVEPADAMANYDDANNALRQLLEAHRALPEADRLAPAPSEIAGYVKTNLMKEMVPCFESPRPGSQKWHTDALNILVKHADWLKLPTPPGTYRLMMQAPKVAAEDVELVVRMKLRVTDQTTTRYSNTISFSLMNCDQPEYTNADWYFQQSKMLFVDIEPWGSLRCMQAMRSESPLQQLSVAEELAGGRQCTLRLIHTAARDEVWIDKRRLLYLPAADHPKKVGFFLQVIGVNADLKVEFAKLDPTLANN